ncbi:MAG: hypothetical protein AB7D51_06370 [Desulfovibrionaceae bacterium]|jgi:hypothetical protein
MVVHTEASIPLVLEKAESLVFGDGRRLSCGPARPGGQGLDVRLLGGVAVVRTLRSGETWRIRCNGRDYAVQAGDDVLLVERCHAPRAPRPSRAGFRSGPDGGDAAPAAA